MATTASNPVQECCVALDTLYNCPDSAAKAQANTWLTNFQKQPVAWQVSDAILQRRGLPPAVYFFATNTLKYKLQWDFQDLPDTKARISFRNSLLAHLKNFANGPTMVRVGLANCLGSLAIYLLAEQEWPECLSEVSQNFASTPLLCLDILTALPDELQNRRACGREDQRSRVGEIYSAFGQTLLGLLKHYIDNFGSNKEVQRGVFTCFVAWIKLGLPLENIQAHPIFNWTFSAVGSDDLQAAACDALCELMHQTREARNQLVEILIVRILSLRSIYERALAERNEELCRKLCVVFVQLGESYLPFIMEGSPRSLGALDTILKCTAHPNKEIATNTLNFWYLVSESIRVSRDNEDIQDRPLPKIPREKIPVFFPVFATLVELLRDLMKYPEEFDSWKPDQKEDEKKFRYQAAEALLDTATVLGTEHCVRRIFGHINEQVSKWLANPQHWQELEASLYAIRSIARKVIDIELDIMPRIMELLPRFTNNSYLRYTATLIVGRYADWICKHPQYLRPLLNYVVSGLNDKEVASSSALAFKHVCDGCASLLSRTLLEPIFQVYNMVHLVPLGDQKEIIEGACFVVVALPLDQVPKMIEKLVTPLAFHLHTYLKNAKVEAPPNNSNNSNNNNNNSNNNSNNSAPNSQPPNNNTPNPVDPTTDVNGTLVRIAEVLRSLDPASCLTSAIHDADRREREEQVMRGVGEVIRKLAPLLDALFERYQHEDRKMEKLCRVWKYAMKASRNYFVPLVPPLVAKLCMAFHHHHRSSFIYTVCVCVETFGTTPALLGVLVEALKNVSTTCVTLLNSPAAFTNNPEVAEDFFEMLSRYLKKMPEVLLQHPVLPKAFESALHGVGVHHKEASAAVMQFLLLLIQDGTDHPRLNRQRNGKPNPLAVATVQKLLVVYGQPLAAGLVVGLTQGLPTGRIKFAMPVLEAMITFARENSKGWLTFAFQQVGETRHIRKSDVFQAIYTTDDIRNVRDTLLKWINEYRRQFQT